jgi:hypothetical protein
MAAVQSGITGPQDRFVGNILQLDRPLLEEIDSIAKRGDFDNRETLALYEYRTVEKLVVHLILLSVRRARGRASRKYAFWRVVVQGGAITCGAPMSL